MKAFIGLDTATTTGYAVYKPVPNTAFVIEVAGTPIEQFEIANFLSRNEEDTFVLEKIHDFRNAITTRNLLERYGFLKWSLLNLGLEVLEVSPGPARAHFACKTKRDMHAMFSEWFVGAYLSTNHTDALAVAMYAAWTRNPAWGMDMPRIAGVGGKVSGKGLSMDEAGKHIREAMK